MHAARRRPACACGGQSSTSCVHFSNCNCVASVRRLKYAASQMRWTTSATCVSLKCLRSGANSASVTAIGVTVEVRTKRKTRRSFSEKLSQGPASAKMAFSDSPSSRNRFSA